MDTPSHLPSIYQTNGIGRSLNIVGVEVRRNKLRLWIPAKVLGDKGRYISTPYGDTSDGWREARRLVLFIEDDLEAGTFDPTLERYRINRFSHLQVVKPALDLAQLWEHYIEHRKPLVSETTFKLNYARVSSHIVKLPYKSLERAVDVRDYLIQHNSPYTSKRILTQLNACCRWGVEAKHIKVNPFEGMAEKVKVVQDDEDINPFSQAERDAIIKGFEEHPIYKHYAPFVRFLFYTGCRTSEAVGLLWKHIDSDCRVITFSEAVVNVSSSKIRKTTKTGKSRRFPCNPMMQEFLLSIRPENYSPDTIVFPSLSGGVINAHTFSALCWKGTTIRGMYQDGIVSKLVKEGVVERYRPVFNTRHTFITMALEAGISTPQVAKWVGNSPEIIMKHYAGTISTVQVPIL